MKKVILSLMIASGMLIGTGYAQNAPASSKAQTTQTATAFAAKPEVKKNDAAPEKSSAKKKHKKHKKGKKEHNVSKKATDKTVASKAADQK